MDRVYPGRREWAIQRPRINQLLQTGLVHPLLTVVAGPGYGKTTAVLDFCRDTPRRLVWMHLLAQDNYSGHFWAHFIEETRQEMPQLAEALDGMAMPDNQSGFTAFLRLLDGVVQQLPGPARLLLVLDNAERVTNPEVNRFIEALIQAEQDYLCILYISNERPNRLGQIGDGQHFFLGAGELGFDAEEARRLYAQYGHTPTDVQLEQTLQETGGWPLALHLIASQPQPARRHAFGETPYLQVAAELFELHYYAPYSAAIQKLLVQLSYFPHSSPGLVQAIGVEDTQQMLATLSDIIFVSYDYSNQQFRFQKMYQDFLALKQELLTEEEVALLHSRAGDWFAAHGYRDEALDCFWRIQDYDRFIDVLLAVLRQDRNPATARLLLGRLEQIPEAYRLAHETVALCRGFLYLNNVQIYKARETFLALEQRLARQAPDGDKSRLLGEVYAALIEIDFYEKTMCAGAYLKKAVELLPQGVHIRSEELLVVGNNEVFFLPDAEPGGIGRVRRYVNSLAEDAHKLYSNSGRGYIHLFMAEAAFYGGHFDDVTEHSWRAIHAAREGGQHDVVGNAYYLQMRLALYMGDDARAGLLLQELAAYTAQHSSARLCAVRDCASAMYHLRLGMPEQVPAWLAGGESLPETLSIGAGRDRWTHAHYLCRTGAYEAGYTALLRLEALLEERKLWGIRLYSHLLIAICQLHMGQEQKAVEAFWRAYQMTWQNHILVCFAECGRATLALLEVAQQHDTHAFDAGWLREVDEAARQYARRESAMVKRRDGLAPPRHSGPTIQLTPREHEVLVGLSQGLTREEISAVLGISLHGVKKHITNIYNKLGAVNRVDALRIAVAGGIIEQAAPG